MVRPAGEQSDVIVKSGPATLQQVRSGCTVITVLYCEGRPACSASQEHQLQSVPCKVRISYGRMGL